jgi:hypothetical protein
MIFALLVLVLRGDGVAGTLAWQVAAHEDDTSASIGVSGYRNDVLYTPYSTDVRLPFWRWRINVPPGATVQSAYIYLHPKQQVGSTPSTIHLELVDTNNCPSLASTNTYALPVLTNGVIWAVPGDWRPDGGEGGTGWYRSTNIASLVQAFIDRPDYAPQQYIGLSGNHVAGGVKLTYQYTDGVTNLGAKLVVTYTGGAVLLNVDMADPEVRSAQKIYCELVNPAAADGLVAFLNGAQVFIKQGGLTTQEVFTANYASLPAGEHELIIRVTSSNGLTRASFSRRWRKLHAGVGAGSINENNALCHNGELFFPLHSYMLDVGRLDSPIGGVVNTLRCEGYYSEHTPQTFSNYLDHGLSKGLPVVGPERWSPNGSLPMESFVQYNRAHPALFGWAWDDEPDLGGAPTPVTEVRRWTDICHSNDTSHPVWVNFSPDSFARPDLAYGTVVGKSYCYLYNDEAFGGVKTPVADVVGFDVYPYEFATKFAWMNIDMLATGIRRLRDWNRDLLPVVAVIEPQDVSASNSSTLAYPWTPGPTPAQLKNLIWVCIVSGAKGVGYFHYFCPTPAENIAVLLEAKSQIAELTPVILSEERSDLVAVSLQSTGRVDCTARLYGGTQYVFAVNMRAQAESADFHVPGLRMGRRIDVLYESRTVGATAGRFMDAMGPFDVRLYSWAMADTATLGSPRNLRVNND